MKNMKIMHLHKLTMSFSDTSKMTDEEYAFLCVMALAIDDVLVLKRLMLQALRSLPSDALLAEVLLAQANTISRLLSAKIIEIDKLIRRYHFTLTKLAPAHPQSAYVEQHILRMTRLKRNPLFKLTQRLRDKLASHYDFDIAKQVIKRTGRKTATAILHPMEGNTRFLFGEDMLMQHIVQDFFSSLYGRAMIIDDLNAWHDYELDWCRQFNDFFFGYLLCLKEDRFPEWSIRAWKPYLEPDFVGDVNAATLPIFLEGLVSEG